jgi:hypothetical protein
MEKNIIDLEVADDLEQSGASAIALVDFPAIEKDWMAFKREEFVNPGAGESQDEFIPRCIAKLVGDEGYENEQAAAICYSTWDEKHTKVEMNDAFLWPSFGEEEFAQTFTDYPEAAKNAAQRALDWAEENGWGSCGTPIGKARANQLAKGRPITEETIARMASFARHRQNSDTPYSEGCGKLMWDAWGGDAGIAWASRKLEQIRRQELSYDTSALPTYVDQTPKKKDQFALQGIPLPRGEKVVLQAEDQNYDRGLVVELLEDGGYNVEYWFDSPDNIEPAEIEVDGETITDSGNLVYIGYHPELEKFAAPASGNKGDRPLARIPKEERGRTGSAKNEPGDSKTTRGGVEVSAEVEGTLKDKIEKHNEKNTQDSQKATLGMLKAVWRRGAGAYSVGTPGKRGMTRSQWAMARVNAFLNILAGNQSGYDKDYKQDNDLLPKGHPKASEQKMSMMFASEDQQILVGPVAIPDMEIVRKVDEGPDKGKPYWVRFSKDVIRKMAEKFMREMRNHDTNIEHNGKDNANTYVMETWLVENEEDKANSMYKFDVPVGTWMVKMRVTDPAVWKQVKEGKLNGFSLEGSFMDSKDFEAYQKDKQLYEKVMRILKSS